MSGGTPGSGRRDAGWLAIVLVAGALGALLGRDGVPGFESARDRQARTQAQRMEAVLARTTAMERSLARLADGPAPACRAVSAPLDEGALRAQITAAVREALPAEGGGTGKDEPGTAQPTPENVEAFEQAKGLMDAAVASGRWGEQHAHALRPLLARMSPEDREELMGRLGTAINGGKLVNTLHGPPF